MNRSTLLRRFLQSGGLVLVMLAAFPHQGFSQLAGSGTITGSVTDASSAVVPAADVTIRNTDTGIERKTQTTDSGIYNAAFLQPGHYEVHVSKAGFAAVLRKDLTLQVGQTLSIDISLQVQTASQEVTVTGAPAVVDSEKTENSQVVSDNAVSNLPVAGRRWDTFVLLTPNVTTDGSSGMVSYRGLSGLYNSNTVDGANNNQALFSEARGRALSGAYVYSLDSIREYQVTASNYSAELGQAAGGVVNAVTKSGANAYHGDLFYYLRYPTWAALDPLPKSLGVYSQPIHQWQQFGGSIGGPIIKDKLFFFGTYDGSRKVNPVTYTTSTKANTLTCPSQLTSTQCGNAQTFLNSLVGTFARATNQDVGFGKLDYQLSQSNHLSTSFDFMNYRAPNAYSTAPSYNNDSIQTNGRYVYHERIFVANLDSTITPTLVNNVRFQWGRDLEVAGANAPAPYVTLTNITNYGEFYALPRTAEPDEHRTQIADTITKAYGRHNIKAGFDLNIIHEVMINLFQGTGRYNYNVGTPQQEFNNWAIDVFGINTGDGLTGRHYNTFVQVNDPITHVGKDDFYNNDIAGFVEDSWKATPKLTLNLGLRYDVFLIPQPPQPNTLTPLNAYYTSTINVPKGQVAPRIGVAWELTPKTVVRTGYGIFYAKTTNTTYYNTRVENGVFQQTFNCTPASCSTLGFPNLVFTPPGATPVAPFPGAITPVVTTFTPPAGAAASRGQAPDWVNPRAHEGDLTIERELGGGISASVAYVVTRGLHLPVFVDANLAPATTTKSYDILTLGGAVTQTYTVPYYTNRIDTNYGIIQAGYSVVNSWYHSLVLSTHRQMRHGLEFMANYTFSKATDGGQISGYNGTFAGSDNPVDPKNLKPEWGLSELDQRHRFVANGVWAPTIGHISNPAAKFLINGWVLSTIVTVGSGHPQQENISGTPTVLDGGLTGGVANNASANAGRVGWVGRDTFIGPGFHDVDFRLARQFSIGERFKLALLGEVFNLFNTTNVASVNTTAYNYLAANGNSTVNGAAIHCPGPNACMVPSPTFLAPTATSSLLWGPRQIQISGRLTF